MDARTKKIIQKMPSTKPLISLEKKDILDPEKYCVINYGERFRVLREKPYWMGREWASLRMYQMFCQIEFFKTTKLKQAHDDQLYKLKRGFNNGDITQETFNSMKKKIDDKFDSDLYAIQNECSYDCDNNICGYNKSKTCGMAWKYRICSIRKSSQSGCSEFALTLIAFLCDVLAWECGYYMPSLEELTKWGRERIHDNLIDKTPRLKKICDTITEAIKFNGRSNLYLFGLHVTPRSYPLNAAIIDEIAEVKNLSNAASVSGGRMNAQKQLERFVLSISTPKIPGRDISAMYDAGTQFRWHIPCPSCGSYEKISFLTHVNKEKCVLECSKCGAELDRLSDGIYIADNPDSDTFSLQFEYTYTLNATIDEMVKLSNTDNLEVLQSFYWHKLGLPYAPEGTEITRAMIMACDSYSRDGYIKQGIRTGGVDVGTGHNAGFDIRISDQFEGKKRAILSCCLPYPQENEVHGDIAWHDLGVFLFEIMQCDLVVVDHMPRVLEARKFSMKYPGKVYRCFFSEKYADAVWFSASEKNPNRRFMVLADRTTIINAVQYQIANKKILYPNGFFTNQLIIKDVNNNGSRYIDHLTSVNRQNIPIPTKEGDTLITTNYKIGWVDKNAKGNHQLLAEAYDSLAGLMYLKQPQIFLVNTPTYGKIQDSNFLSCLNELQEILQRYK